MLLFQAPFIPELAMSCYDYAEIGGSGWEWEGRQGGNLMLVCCILPTQLLVLRVREGKRVGERELEHYAIHVVLGVMMLGVDGCVGWYLPAQSMSVRISSARCYLGSHGSHPATV